MMTKYFENNYCFATDTNVYCFRGEPCGYGRLAAPPTGAEVATTERTKEEITHGKVTGYG